MTFISLFLRRLDEQRGLSEHQPQASMLSIVDRTVKNKRKKTASRWLSKDSIHFFPKKYNFLYIYI